MVELTEMLPYGSRLSRLIIVPWEKVFNLKEALEVLGINNTGDHPPKLKFIQKRFYQLSLDHHPDRPGGDNEIYQNITEAYRFIGDYIQQNYSDKETHPYAFLLAAITSARCPGVGSSKVICSGEDVAVRLSTVPLQIKALNKGRHRN